MKLNYNKIFNIEYDCSSKEMSLRKFDSYIAGAMIGNKKNIRVQLKIFEPIWFERLEMSESTKYKYQITETHIIIHHNQVQHFFTYKA